MGASEAGARGGLLHVQTTSNEGKRVRTAAGVRFGSLGRFQPMSVTAHPPQQTKGRGWFLRWRRVLSVRSETFSLSVDISSCSSTFSPLEPCIYLPKRHRDSEACGGGGADRGASLWAPFLTASLEVDGGSVPDIAIVRSVVIVRSRNAEPSAILANQMEKLQDLSQSELQELLDNPERVEAMALESDEIQNIQLEREMALASNRSLAEQNLDVKPRLEAQKALLVERYSQLEAVRETCRKHCSLRDGMVGQVSPEALLSRLQIEGSKTEEESETLADQFLEGSLPLDSFLERFLSLRSLAHTRRVRIEKLQEILRQRSEGNPTAMTSSAGISQDLTATTSPWNQPATTGPTTNQQQPNSKPQSSSYQNTSQPASSSAGGSSGLPYSPYPVSPPNPSPAAAAAAGSVPAHPPSQFPPYPSSGSPFTPAGSFSGPRPAFEPPTSITCPYPSQAFPSPYPGSAFGQYTPSNPQSGPAPYPASYSYGGYSYPAGPQSPTGRPIYRPGYGVPQPYS